MNLFKGKFALSLIATGIIFSCNALAYQQYDISKAYQGGDKVTDNTIDYEAQWYANPGEKPNPSVANVWENPWKRLTPDTGNDPEPEPEPEPEPDPTPSQYPPFEAGHTYKEGDIVNNAGHDYVCKIANWCSSSSPNYAPGTGFAWDSAWSLVGGNTDNGTGTGDGDDNGTGTETPPPASEYPQFVPGNAYKQGDIVNNLGSDYVCLVANWCSSPSESYTPGVGFAWSSAWSLLNGEVAPGLEVTQADLDAKEEELTNTPQLNAVKDSLKTLDNAAVEKIAPGAASNPSNVKRVEQLITPEKWELFFPHRDPAYTYDNFLKAVGKFPILCGDHSDGKDADAICRKTLATMFAHFVQETGEHAAQSDVAQWQQGLHWVREMGLDETSYDKYTGGTCDPNTWQGKAWPCATDANGNKLSYFGRGAKQLSYNFNYGQFSQAMYGDVNVLLQQPSLVADTWLNLASAIFFYIQPQPPKPSMQAVIDGSWQPNDADKANGLVPGFGVTTQIINGGVECGGSTEMAQTQNRISYYKEFAKQLGVPIADDEVLGCANMKQFTENGAAALNLFWVKDYSYVASNPGGQSYACQLVNWQENDFSALVKGDYTRCVKESFPDIVIKN